ncbi:MAG: hypothetical protein GY769_07915 [bacterium]|nr:hypothetical protein [bacterium]
MPRHWAKCKIDGKSHRLREVVGPTVQRCDVDELSFQTVPVHDEVEMVLWWGDRRARQLLNIMKRRRKVEFWIERDYDSVEMYGYITRLSAEEGTESPSGYPEMRVYLKPRPPIYRVGGRA